MVDFESADADVPSFLKVSEIEDWLTRVVRGHQKSLGDLTVIFCSDDYLLEVNKEYLQHDYYTDIITFDYSENSVVSGDLFISVDRVAENAEELKVAFRDEVLRVIVHGVLHLCGFKDKSESDSLLMRSAEDKALALLN